MRTLSAALAMVLTASAANAQLADTVGVGVRMCGEVAKDYQNNPSEWESTYYSWAQGFMSGLNLGNELNRKPSKNLEGIAIPGQMARLRGYCNNDPLARYDNAVFDLYNNLPNYR